MFRVLSKKREVMSAAMSAIGSRDLREIVSGPLRVTIQGRGDFTSSLPEVPLVMHVSQAAVIITREAYSGGDPANSRWEIVSFDRAAQRLTVKEVEG